MLRVYNSAHVEAFFSMKRSINPIPLAIAMAILVGCVLIGVLGTRLQEREFGALLPLGVITDTARQIQSRMQIEAIHRPAESPTPTRSDLADLVSSTIKSEWRPPDLSAKGFVPILAGQAILLGDQAGIAILYERAGESPDRFLALFVTSDRGQFASFDEFGRIEPLTTNRAIIERDEETDPNSSATLVFSDGGLLFLARADDVATLDEIRSDLGAP